jgi:hypothetical protein
VEKRRCDIQDITELNHHTLQSNVHGLWVVERRCEGQYMGETGRSSKRVKNIAQGIRGEGQCIKNKRVKNTA